MDDGGGGSWYDPSAWFDEASQQAGEQVQRSYEEQKEKSKADKARADMQRAALQQQARIESEAMARANSQRRSEAKQTLLAAQARERREAGRSGEGVGSSMLTGGKPLGPKV
jgi:hypothetical protein